MFDSFGNPWTPYQSSGRTYNGHLRAIFGMKAIEVTLGSIMPGSEHLGPHSSYLAWKAAAQKSEIGLAGWAMNSELDGRQFHWRNYTAIYNPTKKTQ